ncbi:hypothetical protein LUX57_48555 [Actinomadura madurae]|nr:hypothetical protein [Actinomadura madurae]MCP9971970.1 hypothetical protein [Actinomadura madurae]
MSRVPRDENVATSTPPMAKPQICMVPADMFRTERPRIWPSRGRISLSRL